MHEHRPGSSHSHRLALLALARLIERRSRMAKLFKLMEPVKELKFGDIEQINDWRIENF